MVLKKRTFKRKVRRPFRRFVKRTRVMRSYGNNSLYKYKQMFTLSTSNVTVLGGSNLNYYTSTSSDGRIDFGTSSSASLGSIAFQFTLSDLPNVSPFTSLYDQYRITYIKLEFRPDYNMAEIGLLSGTPIIPPFFVVHDYDDASALTTMAQARSYQSCKEYSPFRKFSVGFKPHIAVAAYTAGGPFTSYSNVVAPWIDLASPSVAHYGIKIMQTQTNYAGSIALAATMWVEFRNVR